MEERSDRRLSYRRRFARNSIISARPFKVNPALLFGRSVSHTDELNIESKIGRSTRVSSSSFSYEGSLS